MATALSREVQITREEFERQLPEAVDGRPVRRDGDAFVVDATDSGRVRIAVTNKGEKELGMLDLPMMQVDFAFENMSDEEARLFMQTYDTHKMRMGGM